MLDLSLIADILVRSAPLLLTGLAVTVAFRAGILNIGAEGQLLMGAAGAAAIGVTCGDQLGIFTLPIALLTGTVAGGIWAFIASYLKTRFSVLEVISTIMLNFVAAYFISYLVRGPLQEPLHIYPQTATIHTAAQFTRLVPGTRLHLGIILAVGIAIVAAWFFRSASAGFRWNVTGANPFAARSAGRIDTTRVTTHAFLASGMLAGLAGAMEVCGVTFALYENISPGYGYTGIAVALLGALNPLWVIVTAILFGTLESIAGILQRDANIPSTLAAVIEAGIILLVIAVTQVRRRRLAAGPV